MTTRISVESGSEYLLPFAKRKLAQLKEIGLQSCRVDASDGARIFVHNAEAISKGAVDTIRIMGGPIETFFGNFWGEVTWNTDDFRDQYTIAQTAKSGIFSAWPALGKYPLAAIRRLIAAKQWGAVWFFCNVYFAGDVDGDDHDWCAYLKFGWEDSEIGTDVLVIDPAKLRPWNFFGSGYPQSRYENVLVEDLAYPDVRYATLGATVDPFYLSRFSADVTVADLTALLSPFFGTIVNNEPPQHLVSTSNEISINGSMVYYAADHPPGDGTNVAVLMNQIYGPFDHDGAYVVRTEVASESLSPITVRGIDYKVRTGASSTVNFTRYDYARRVTGYTVTGSSALPLTLVSTRVASSFIRFGGLPSNFSNTSISVSQSHFVRNDSAYLEKSKTFVVCGDTEYAFYNGLIVDPPGSIKLSPGAPLALSRISSTVLPFPSGVVNREYRAANGWLHRNYIDGTYEVYDPVSATVKVQHKRAVDDPYVFGVSPGLGFGWSDASTEVFGISISQTHSPVVGMDGGFEWATGTHSSIEAVWAADITSVPRVVSPRVFPSVSTRFFQEYKHFLFRPTTGDFLIADYPGGVSDAGDAAENSLLLALRDAYLHNPTPVNRDAFAARFDVLYRSGIDTSLLMHSGWWRYLTLII